MLILQALLHAADISNPTRPWDLCYKWTNLVIEEFFAQGDKEREMGLPISNLCDRNTVLVPKA